MIYHNRAIHKKEMYLYGKRNTQFSFWKDNLTIYCLIFSTYFEIPFMKLYYESHYYDKKTTLAIPISYMSTKFSCYFFLIQTIHRWWDLEKIIQLIWSKKKKKGKSMFHASLFGIWRHSRNQKHLSLLFDLIYKLF